MNWKYIKATNTECIEKVDKDFFVNLPRDLKDIILKFNNGRPENSTFDTDKSTGRQFKKLLSFNREDRENVYFFVDIVRQFDNELFPIANDPAGNFICLKNSEIVFLNIESGKTEFIANSITDLISKLY